MNVLIDCSNLKVGGGIQVATSFLNDLNKLDTEDDNIIQELKFYIVLSPQMEEQFNKTTFSSRFVFIELNKGIAKTKIRTSAFLKSIESKCNIDKVFCVFGPSYYKSKVSKIVGYAIPHYIYHDSPYFDTLNFKERARTFILKRIQINLFKRNSDALIFETIDARDRFIDVYKYAYHKTFVVNNTLNQIFLHQKKWVARKFNFKVFKRILVLSANYPHKNMSIIPSVIDSLINDHSFTDFKFIISQTKEKMRFDNKYDEYIEYLGYIPLEELPALYQSVDVLFLPTLLECFSTTYLEAMFMRVPIVTTEMSFSKNICDDAAVYFSPTSASCAADKISKIFNNENFRSKLISNGIENLNRFSDSMSRTKDYINIIKTTS